MTKAKPKKPIDVWFNTVELDDVKSANLAKLLGLGKNAAAIDASLKAEFERCAETCTSVYYNKANQALQGNVKAELEEIEQAAVKLKKVLGARTAVREGDCGYIKQPHPKTKQLVIRSLSSQAERILRINGDRFDIDHLREDLGHLLDTIKEHADRDFLLQPEVVVTARTGGAQKQLQAHAKAITADLWEYFWEAHAHVTVKGDSRAKEKFTSFAVALCAESAGTATTTPPSPKRA